MGDKLEHKGEEIRGEVKEAAGRATGDRDLEAEGRGESAVADLKQAGDKVKDAFDR